MTAGLPEPLVFARGALLDRGMSIEMTDRRAVVIAFLIFVTMFGAGVWRYGYVQALNQLADRGEADLTLATDRITGQLQLYQQLAVLTAQHPDVTAVLNNGPVQGIKAFLQGVADKTGALDVAVVDPMGRVLSSASGAAGRSLGASNAFSLAMQGALGEEHGVAGQTRVYTFAAPVFGAAGPVIGALVVVVDVERVEAEWRGARPAVFLTDKAGLVFISNRPEILFWQRATPGLVPPDGSTPEFSVSWVAGHEIWHEKWSPYLPSKAMHLVRDIPMIGMQAEAMIDVTPAQRLAGLQAALVVALCLVFGAMLFLATERRRTLTLANARLEGRVAERTAELSTANAALRHEVLERTAAEAALKKAQADLVQAGKLSALGQMSAGISHELNQPLMAIQQYAENGALYMERGNGEAVSQNLGRIADLARRMARIIKNLRAFSRQESEPVTRVNLVQVVENSLELSEARLRNEGVAIEWSRPNAPIWVMGGEVRLGQVLVNLISNAMDAMANSPQRRIAISITQSDARVTMEVADTGPGIRELERIFDPFYSTKEVGASEGMGLGLSISYGLVQSFGGAIRGRNRAQGGAVFSVELTASQEEAV